MHNLDSHSSKIQQIHQDHMRNKTKKKKFLKTKASMFASKKNQREDEKPIPYFLRRPLLDADAPERLIFFDLLSVVSLRLR